MQISLVIAPHIAPVSKLKTLVCPINWFQSLSLLRELISFPDRDWKVSVKFPHVTSPGATVLVVGYAPPIITVGVFKDELNSKTYP